MRRWKKQDKLMEEPGEDWRRYGSYIDKTRNRQVRLFPPTTPLYVHRAPFGVQSSPKPRVTFQLRGKEKGQGQ
jgi:hypothetical protein